MNFWNKNNICLTSPKSIMIITALLLSTFVLANVLYTSNSEIIEDGNDNPEEVDGMWVPTTEDIAYQDSMFSLIKNTQNDVTDIKQDIVHIIERLDYVDGTHDSVRYVKGGKIDKKRN